MRTIAIFTLLPLLLLSAAAFAQEASPAGEAAPAAAPAVQGAAVDPAAQAEPPEAPVAPPTPKELAAVPAPSTAEVRVAPLTFLSYAFAWEEKAKSPDDPASSVSVGYLQPLLITGSDTARDASLGPLQRTLLEAFIDACGVKIPLPERIETNDPAGVLAAVFAIKRREGEAAQAETRELGDEIPTAFGFSATCEALVAKGRYLSFCIDTYMYAPGAAHGLTNRACQVVDLTTGARVPHDKLLRADGKETAAKLFALIEKKIRAARGIAPDAKLEEEGFFPENFAPTGNVYLTDEGVGFHYNVYEIACYANGPDDVVIPWAELPADLLAEGSPLLQYLPKK